MKNMALAAYHGLATVVILSSGCSVGPSIYEVLDCDPALDDAQVAPTLHVDIDPRVELMSIIYYLSGTHREYAMPKVPLYKEAVEAHFGAHRKHPAVKYVRGLSDTYGYDKPMTLAVFLTDAKNLGERVPFTNPIPYGLANSWYFTGIGKARKLVKLARYFSEDTDFGSFFESREPLFTETLKRAGTLFDKANISQWCLDYFGEGLALEFHLVLGMINGPCSYAGQVCFDDTREIYSILGVRAVDREGIPIFREDMLGTVLHELGHAYINELVGQNWQALRKPGKRLFARVRKQMVASAYGSWPFMVQESIVRAVVIRRVLETRGLDAAKHAIEREKQKGFFFMEELVEVLGEYETHREKYPTFRSFFPRIVEFFHTHEAKASV